MVIAGDPPFVVYPFSWGSILPPPIYPMYPAPSSTAQSCPVCSGRGQVESEFYNNGVPTTAMYVTCRSCSGSGVVWRHDGTHND